jgi:hypothetical protein
LHATTIINKAVITFFKLIIKLIQFFTQETHIPTDIGFNHQEYVDIMNKKSQELELRNIMQGLEEFATFMSFRANSNGLRILSVESVEQPQRVQPKTQTAHILTMPHQSLNKSLSFQDRDYH